MPALAGGWAAAATARIRHLRTLDPILIAPEIAILHPSAAHCDVRSRFREPLRSAAIATGQHEHAATDVESASVSTSNSSPHAAHRCPSWIQTALPSTPLPPSAATLTALSSPNSTSTPISVSIRSDRRVRTSRPQLRLSLRRPSPLTTSLRVTSPRPRSPTHTVLSSPSVSPSRSLRLHRQPVRLRHFRTLLRPRLL